MKAIRLYAQILVDVAAAPGAGLDLNKLVLELKGFASILSESPTARKTFQSPAISEDEKNKILTALCDRDQVSPMSRRFLALLAKRGRLEVLPEILVQIETLQIEKAGGLIGDLVSAVQLDAAALSEVTQALSKKMKKPVHLNSKVDPSVIAGIKVTVSGVTYDGTVRSKLDKLATNS
jgi:F-type H+-transporting ATPase subunit delta